MDTPWQTLTVATLLFQILLALGALPSGESSNAAWKLTKKCGLPKEELDQLVKEFNAHRLEVAEKDQIANMHEIRYDFKLENTLANGSIDCLRTAMCFKMDDSTLKFGSPIIQNYSLITGFAFCSFQWPDSEPYGYFLYVPMEKYKNRVVYGPPGSQCPNGKAASGLCKAPWNTEPITLPVPSTQPAEGIDNGAHMAYSFGLILLVILLV